MSRIYKPITFFALFFLIISLSSATPFTNDTVIYIVRHAEKDTTDPKNNDPELNSGGRKRVRALNHYLRKTRISAVFSTSFNRTMQTVDPIALRNGIKIKPYDSKKPDELINVIGSKFSGKNVLIAGHSNTVLELVKAFGVTPPIDKLNDDDYDLIFIITLRTNGERDLKIRRYGKIHHSTEIAFSRLAP